MQEGHVEGILESTIEFVLQAFIGDPLLKFIIEIE